MGKHSSPGRRNLYYLNKISEKDGVGGSQLLLKKMIVGHGIDIQELASIQNAVEKREGFARRVLTDKEMERFSSLKGRRHVRVFGWSLVS